MRSLTDEEDSENEENYQSCSDDAEDVKTASHSSSQRRFKKETMRDVLISVVLLGLTTLVTHGDFQTSPTASILASGNTSKNIFNKNLCSKFCISSNKSQSNNVVGSR